MLWIGKGSLRSLRCNQLCVPDERCKFVSNDIFPVGVERRPYLEAGRRGNLGLVEHARVHIASSLLPTPTEMCMLLGETLCLSTPWCRPLSAHVASPRGASPFAHVAARSLCWLSPYALLRRALRNVPSQAQRYRLQARSELRCLGCLIEKSKDCLLALIISALRARCLRGWILGLRRSPFSCFTAEWLSPASGLAAIDTS